MTVDEAINVLRWLNPPRANKNSFDNFVEAIKMAIEALSCSEFPNNSDTISRQQAIDAIYEDADWLAAQGSDWQVERMERDKSILKSLPSVQPDTTTHGSNVVKKGGNDEDRTSGDCINRQQAINKIKPWLEVKGYSWGELNMLRAVINELENMPSAQPETAKRIVGKSRDGMTLWYQCDMCNEPVDAQDNFCRGCGRRLIDG